jgi:hypothetical protein
MNLQKEPSDEVQARLEGDHVRMRAIDCYTVTIDKKRISVAWWSYEKAIDELRK